MARSPPATALLYFFATGPSRPRRHARRRLRRLLNRFRRRHHRAFHLLPRRQGAWLGRFRPGRRPLACRVRREDDGARPVAALLPLRREQLRRASGTASSLAIVVGVADDPARPRIRASCSPHALPREAPSERARRAAGHHAALRHRARHYPASSGEAAW